VLREWLLSALLDVYYGSLPRENSSFRRAVLWDEQGAAVARMTLAERQPCLIARLGTSELGCVSVFTRWRRRKHIRVSYPESLRHIMGTNAGMFPTDNESLDNFSQIFLDAVSKTDVMGVWFNRNEHRIIEEFCPRARLVHLEALNCVLRENPWSAELAGKTVLVVHPFAKTIERQYATRRDVLFENPRVLPEFELKTLSAVQSSAGADSGFETWFDALKHMRAEIEAMEFDIAIIGAGAYGLPLAAAVKDTGRKAVHYGGATQLLFGILGKRWEEGGPDEFTALFNEHWVRPAAEETPQGSGQVEGGCYW
jgi:hypothetical protein